MKAYLMLALSIALASQAQAGELINDKNMRLGDVWNCQMPWSGKHYSENVSAPYVFNKEGWEIKTEGQTPEEIKEAREEKAYVSYFEFEYADLVSKYKLSNDKRALIGFSFFYKFFVILQIDENGSMTQNAVSVDNPEGMDQIANSFKGEIPADLMAQWDMNREGVTSNKKILASLLAADYSKPETLQKFLPTKWATCSATSKLESVKSLIGKNSEFISLVLTDSIYVDQSRTFGLEHGRKIWADLQSNYDAYAVLYVINQVENLANTLLYRCVSQGSFDIVDCPITNEGVTQLENALIKAGDTYGVKISSCPSWRTEGCDSMEDRALRLGSAALMLQDAVKTALK